MSDINVYTYTCIIKHNPSIAANSLVQKTLPSNQSIPFPYLFLGFADTVHFHRKSSFGLLDIRNSSLGLKNCKNPGGDCYIGTEGWGSISKICFQKYFFLYRLYHLPFLHNPYVHFLDCKWTGAMVLADFLRLSSVVTWFESKHHIMLCRILEDHQQPGPTAIVRLSHPTASPCGHPAARRPSWLPPAHEAFETGGVGFPASQVPDASWWIDRKTGRWWIFMMIWWLRKILILCCWFVIYVGQITSYFCEIISACCFISSAADQVQSALA